MARNLGQTKFGEYAYAIAIISILGIISNFGLNTLLVKDVSREKGLAGVYLAKAISVKSFIAILCIVGAFFINLILGYSWELIIIILIFSLSLPFQMIFSTCQSVYQALEKMEFIGAMSMGRSFLSLGLIIFVISLGFSLPMIVLMQTLSYAIVGGVGLYFLLSNVGRIKLLFGVNELAKFGRQGLPFLKIAVIYILYHKSDVLMLQKMKGPDVVGLYSAAFELVAGFYVIPSILSIVLFPVFSQQSMTSLEDLHRSSYYSLKLLLILSLPMSAGLFILAPNLIPLVFGQPFLASIGALQVLAFTFCFSFPREILGFVLTSLEKAQELVLINFLGLVVNIMLNLILIPTYSHVGASFATLLSLAITTGFCYCRMVHYLGPMSLFSLLIKPLMAGFTMAGLIFFLRIENILLVLLFGVISYSYILWILKAFSQEEILIVKEAFKRRFISAGT